MILFPKFPSTPYLNTHIPIFQLFESFTVFGFSLFPFFFFQKNYPIHFSLIIIDNLFPNYSNQKVFLLLRNEF
ncbi:hypothetical protein A4A49_32104 [Nicotiana attenuata]|uniref:Uncharacterized protein n=1 Tax=Nicotiana attenuata TaxID=49451 RepID=A0A1J6KBD4_NICAT|nr:hypothetical protein A4A49_32104 [Nicotiana attenuata]